MRRRNWLWSIAGCLSLLVLAACAESAAPNPVIPLSDTPQAKEPGMSNPVEGMDGNPTQAPELEPSPDSTQQPPSGRVIRDLTPVAVDDPLAYKIVGRATADLAAMLSVDAKDIRLSGVSAVTWPDASLGCPEPEKVYPVVRTPGYRVELEFGGKIYTYHTDRSQAMVYCEGPDLTFPGVWDADESVQRAKLDLSQRLGIPIDEITVSAVLGQEFTAQAFQCQTVKERITRDENPAVVFGKVILLMAGGQKYEYHVNGQQAIFCRLLK